jgi:molybdopterin biosynthesis enzyme
VTTGGPVPSFFDCVIPIEDTELIVDSNDANAPKKIKIMKEMQKD